MSAFNKARQEIATLESNLGEIIQNTIKQLIETGKCKVSIEEIRRMSDELSSKRAAHKKLGLMAKEIAASFRDAVKAA